MGLDHKETPKYVPDSKMALEEEPDLEVPAGYECPITHEIMQDPVMAADGHSYEKAAIEEWFKQGKHLSPLTGKKLPYRTLIPNVNLKKAITEFVKKRPILKRKKEEKEEELASLRVVIQLREEELAERLSKLALQERKYAPIVSKEEQHKKLLRAAEQGDLEAVNRLLAAGIHVDTEVTEEDYTPLWAATKAPDSQVFRRLLEAKADARITAGDDSSIIFDDYHTLAQAIALKNRWPHAEKARLLKQLSECGISLLPIHEATTVGDEKAVMAEIKKGQGKAIDEQGLNVLQYAAANGHTSILQRFIKTDAIMLHWLEKEEPELETVKWLLKEGGLPVGDAGKADLTALLRAARNGQLATVQWLLREGGSKVTERSMYDGTTALMYAASNGHLATAQWLLREGGAKITEQDQDGDTALLWAAQNGHLATVQWLLREGGAKITEQNKNGETAVLLAAWNGHLETVQWLLREGGAKITEQDQDGDTAFCGRPRTAT